MATPTTANAISFFNAGIDTLARRRAETAMTGRAFPTIASGSSGAQAAGTRPRIAPGRGVAARSGRPLPALDRRGRTKYPSGIRLRRDPDAPGYRRRPGVWDARRTSTRRWPCCRMAGGRCRGPRTSARRAEAALEAPGRRASRSSRGEPGLPGPCSRRFRTRRPSSGSAATPDPAARAWPSSGRGPRRRTPSKIGFKLAPGPGRRRDSAW